jgi:hypothetical protein
MFLVIARLVLGVTDTANNFGEGTSLARMERVPERLGGENGDVVGCETRVAEVVPGNDTLCGLGIAGVIIGGVLHQKDSGVIEWW